MTMSLAAVAKAVSMPEGFLRAVQADSDASSAARTQASRMRAMSCAGTQASPLVVRQGYVPVPTRANHLLSASAEEQPSRWRRCGKKSGWYPRNMVLPHNERRSRGHHGALVSACLFHKLRLIHRCSAM